MSSRSPEEILAELGRELLAARPRRRWWRWSLAAVLTGMLVVPAALATRPVWVPESPVPESVRPVDAPRPDAATRSTWVARGERWRLAAARCAFGAHTIVVVHLTTPVGGAGRGCEALTPESVRGRVMAPMVYSDPLTHHALLFGAVPHGITRVQALLHRAGQRATVLREIALDRTYFVAPIPSDARVLTVIGLDARGEPRLRCDPYVCTEESP